MFLDSDESPNDSPVLLIGVDKPTQRSQFLAHFSFTPEDAKDTGVRLKGARKLTNAGVLNTLANHHYFYYIT